MILKLVFYCCLLYFGSTTETPEKCLTGLMTDVQTWVDEYGRLTDINNENAMDMSNTTNPSNVLKQRMDVFKSEDNRSVEYLSLAKCQLTRIPQIFRNEDGDGRPLYATVKYLTLFGNNFQQESTPGSDYNYNINATSVRNTAAWSYGLRTVTFTSLQELDLRSCNIQVLYANTFSRMPTLNVLYLSHNHITLVERQAFYGLTNLIHLDLSRNFYNTPTKSPMLNWAYVDILKDLTKMISLDLSYTKISNVNVFKYLGIRFQRLSLCYSGVSRLKSSFFMNTSLKFLDLSGNTGVLGDALSMVGIENTLEVLYADAVSLQNLNVLNNFHKLEILKASNNDINIIRPTLAKSWKHLQVLELDNNRISSWFKPVFSLMTNLRLLSLRSNNLNLITDEMLNDIAKVHYISLGGNLFFCNCHSREFFDVAFMNENMRTTYRNLQPITEHRNPLHLAVNYHEGFDRFNDMITKRAAVAKNCTINTCIRESEPNFYDNRAGDFLILDYNIHSYSCMVLEDGSMEHFSNSLTCSDKSRDDINNIIRHNSHKLLFLIVPVVLIPVLALGYVFRRAFKYFIITMRNSAMLSMINNMDHVDDGAIFNYDVFVSYCNEDRPWVLDYLLPHVERDCNVSVCLHERDFQVGLPILENIVSCMDRSRSIMLIISQRFLLSQWCQFEMHLAQHRLLETRREDLILILLEDIPRKLRPNTLHYLMLTKTYIVWPRDITEQTLFWKRLKKTIVTQKLKITENDSLA